MAQPPAYTRAYNFANYQASNPSDPLPASQVDAEFNRVKLTTDALRANVALIQRDDGALANGVATYDALSAQVKALLATPVADLAAVSDYTIENILASGAAAALSGTDGVLVEQSGLLKETTIALIDAYIRAATKADIAAASAATTGVSTLLGVDGSGGITNVPAWLVTPLENGTNEPVPTTQPVIAHALRPSQAGLHYAVDYESDRTDKIIYGYTANVKRTGTGTALIAVGAQLNAYELSTAGSPVSIFGGATEAWSGDSDTEPSISATLIGWESAVISQRHDNTQRLVGMNSVFKNRRDGATTLLHGALGDNKYNYNSVAFLVSSQTATATGEYCGWKYGLYFDSGSMDLDTAGGAIGIDMANVLSTKLAYAIRIPGNAWIGLNGTGVDDIKMRYLNTSKFVQISSGSSEYIGFDLSSGANLALRINSTKVVGTRKTGWTVATGTATRTAFDTATVTTAQLAERVKALIDDLHATAGHGLIGT